jgi:hypothetical protein
MFHPVLTAPDGVIVVVNVDVWSTPLSVTADEVAVVGAIATANAARDAAANDAAKTKAPSSANVPLIRSELTARLRSQR